MRGFELPGTRLTDASRLKKMDNKRRVQADTKCGLVETAWALIPYKCNYLRANSPVIEGAKLQMLPFLSNGFSAALRTSHGRP